MSKSMIQPYFVMSTPKYYKSVIANMGISHFYSFSPKDIQGNGIIVVPDGCIDILFNCSESNPTAQLCGSVLEASNVETNGIDTYFGVRFYPGEGYDLDNIQTKEIINNQIPLTDVLDAGKLFENIISTRCFNQRIKFFTNHYLDLKRRNHDFPNKISVKNYMLNKIIASKGNIRINDLASEMGYSTRYINKKFIEFFGMNPKSFSKIIRFQHILITLKGNIYKPSSVNLLDLSLKAGYYDQSHMIKDFNQLSKQTPTMYLTLLKQTNYMSRLIQV